MSSKHVLLVEGINDLHAVRNLVYQHGISVHYSEDEEGPASEDAAFQIKEIGGRSNFSRAIETHLKLDDLQVLGVVADADCDYAACWKARLNELFCFEEGRSFTTLDDYDVENGWSGETRNQIDDPVRVGVWVMPDNTSIGALEDFAEELIPDTEDDRYLWDRAQTVVENLEVQRFRDVDRGKAQMHTWLAWQDPPRELIGRSINREQGGLNPQSPSAVALVAWIQRLFPATEDET